MVLGAVAGTRAPLAAQPPAPTPAAAPTLPQTPVAWLFRALALEDSSRYRDAEMSYRRALADGAALDTTQQMLALLGFERVATELGMRDTVLAVVERWLTQQPRDATAQAIRLRTVRAIGANVARSPAAQSAADSLVRAAFRDWCRVAPRDPAPYREYVRLLLEQRRLAVADTILQEGAAILPDLAGLRPERAQVDAMLGRWGSAGRAWAEAVREQPWNELAALFSLQAARSSGRDSVRAALTAARRASAGDLSVVFTRLAARLELGWGDARQAWNTVQSLAPSDSVIVLWRDIAERFEFNESWTLARDAWARTSAASGRPDDALRLAQAALLAGDPARALAAAQRVIEAHRAVPLPTSAADSVGRRAARERSRALPLLVEALARQGRLTAADSVLASAGAIDDVDRRAVQRAMAVGWLRAGDAAKATAAFPALEEDDELRGWRALLAGDLAVARKALARAGSREPVLVTVLSIVARTTALRSAAIGRLVAALAAADTTAIVAACDSAAAAHADAAPALLTLAARTAPDSTQPARWAVILARYPRSVEAPEAALELARATARRGRVADAIPLYEQMILDYPDSALVPLARRELERLQRPVPGFGAPPSSAHPREIGQ